MWVFLGFQKKKILKNTLDIWLEGSQIINGEDHRGKKNIIYKENYLGFRGKVMLLKEIAPGIAFLGCSEGYFFLKIKKERRSRFKGS